MSVNSEIADLQTNLSNAKSAVTTAGGTVGDTGLAGLAGEIGTIPSGGSASDFYHLSIDTASYQLASLIKAIPAVITIGNTITNIDETFRETTNLEGTITLSGGGGITTASGLFRSATLSGIDISDLSFSANGVNLAYFAYQTPNLTSINMPHNIKVTSVGQFMRASITDSSPATIDFSGWDTSTCNDFSYVFAYRSHTTTINISGWTNPNSKSTQGMLRDTSSLTTLIIDSPEVFNLSGSSVFSNSGIAAGTGFVYVPDSLVTSYQAASGWSTYASQIKGLSELPA